MIQIENKKIDNGEPVFIIAEISCNHLQNKEYALKLIEEAKKAGADAVKFQTYTPDTITINCNNEYFQLKDTIWEGKNLYELYQEAYTPWDWFPELFEKAKEEGLICLSTPFDETAVDLLEELNVPVYKIASFEINHIPLLKKVARTKKPIIISTGIAGVEDIELALETIRKEGNNQIILLKCTSAYPAPLDEMNLKTMQDMEKRFNVMSGLSDHTSGIIAPIVATSLGAKVIEKHFILDRKEGGHDAKFSIEPEEFKEMVQGIRDAEKIIGKINYEKGEETKKHTFVKRSIFVVKDVKEGEIFTNENIKVIRPGHGLEPKYYEEILGKKSKQNIKFGTPMKKEYVEM